MKKSSRRRFILGGTTAAAVAVGGCLCSKTGRATLTGVGDTPLLGKLCYTVDAGVITVDLSRAEQLARPGGSIKIVDDRIDDSLIVARMDDDMYAAVSIRCTHRGVEVEYRHEKGCFQCASLGGSKFSTDGEEMKGFADKPLRQYEVARNENFLEIRLS